MRLATTEVLDLNTMAFTPGPNLLSIIGRCAAVKLDAHRWLVVGGSGVEEHLNATGVIVIATVTFTTGPVMDSARRGCLAATLDSRHMLLVGGRNNEDGELASLTTQM